MIHLNRFIFTCNITNVIRKRKHQFVHYESIIIIDKSLTISGEYKTWLFSPSFLYKQMRACLEREVTVPKYIKSGLLSGLFRPINTGRY